MADRRATYADIEALPENVVGEILDGELVVSPRPAVGHALATTRLGAVLGSSFDGPPSGSDRPGGWWILDEPELHLHGDVVVPDIAAWRRARLPRLPDAAAIELAPDFVCEALSPSTFRVDRTKKMRIYRREGVGHLWFVDRERKTLEAYRLERERWVVAAVHVGDEKVRVEPFEAVEIDLARLWDLGEK